MTRIAMHGAALRTLVSVVCLLLSVSCGDSSGANGNNGQDQHPSTGDGDSNGGDGDGDHPIGGDGDTSGGDGDQQCTADGANQCGGDGDTSGGDGDSSGGDGDISSGDGDTGDGDGDGDGDTGDGDGDGDKGGDGDGDGDKGGDGDGDGDKGGDGDTSGGDGDTSGGDGDKGGDGDTSGGDGDKGGDGDTSGGDGDTSGLVWHKANMTEFESYPDPNSEECIEFSGCEYEGEFAGVDGKQTEDWVSQHNIIAVHSRDWREYKLHTLRLRSGNHTIDAVVYDECRDADCSGCCTENASETGFLIDVESYTYNRFGSDADVIEWTCLDC